MNNGKVVVPGEFLFNIGERFIPGHGCQQFEESFFACVYGKIRIQNINKDEEFKILNVFPQKMNFAPKSDSIVFGRVVNVNVNNAKVRILCVDGNPIESDSFLGTINKKDVREKEVDKVRILESYCPGDVVKARVLSMGTKKICNLSTSRRDLGVVFAKSKAGYPLNRINEREGICSVSKSKEKRKFGITKRKKYKKRKRKKRDF